MSQEQLQPLSREQLAQKFDWQDNFPLAIQKKLYEHYQQFQHHGNLHRAEMDIQSVSDALYNVAQGKSVALFLSEHEQYFGIASTTDLSRIAQELIRLRQEGQST